MKQAIFALVLLSGLAACNGRDTPAKPDALSVSDAVVRLSPVEGRPASAYFTLHGGKANDRLTAISSPKAATIELHESQMQGGVMRMQPLTGVDVPAGGKVAFKPGSYHAMLFGVDPAVKAGGTMPLHFILQSGASVDAEAKAISAGDDMPMAMEHDGH